LGILTAVDLAIKPSECLAILGASGSGKSTLLGLLAGLDVPTSGEVFIFDQRLRALDEDGRAKVRLAHVGFVFQSFHLIEQFTALENVMLPLELKGLSKSRVRALELLTEVGLKNRLNHYPTQLSGGEQQRVALARAFASEPDVLFADEPTGNLDAGTAKSISDLLFNMNESYRTTLILVTHDEHLADRCALRVRLEAGRLTEEIKAP
jgi:putative ABC transport system ATP-binding protein